MDLREHVDDAAALLDTLSASPAVVIGRSTGGLIALELAHRHPRKVKALVLLEPALFSVDSDAAAWAKRLCLLPCSLDGAVANAAESTDSAGCGRTRLQRCPRPSPLDR
jgi:pimeloyl-ACP methyl ester carboxylesterase